MTKRDDESVELDMPKHRSLVLAYNGAESPRFLDEHIRVSVPAPTKADKKGTGRRCPLSAP